MRRNVPCTFFALAAIGMGYVSCAQSAHYNSQDGYVARGFDVVEYFNNRALSGKDTYTFQYHGVSFRFATAENLQRFKADPEKYIPQYGGWCAYGMATSGKRYGINPANFEVREGKLFLFYNTFLFNAQERWLVDPAKWIEKADAYWRKQEESGKN